MSQALVHVPEPAQKMQLLTLTDKFRYADLLSKADMLPAAYRGKPGNVLLAVEMGEALGINPYVAIQGLHIIEGKPTGSAALISSLVRRAGHRLRVQGNETEATCTITRRDDPDYPFVATWTIERAKQADLLKKDTWRKYPAAMLKSRAITECARDACQEALNGVQYTPEELGANVDAEGQIISERTTVEPAPRSASPAPSAVTVEVKPAAGPRSPSKQAQDLQAPPVGFKERKALLARVSKLQRDHDGVKDANGKIEIDATRDQTKDRIGPWLEDQPGCVATNDRGYADWEACSLEQLQFAVASYEALTARDQAAEQQATEGEWVAS